MPAENQQTKHNSQQQTNQVMKHKITKLQKTIETKPGAGVFQNTNGENEQAAKELLIKQTKITIIYNGRQGKVCGLLSKLNFIAVLGNRFLYI